MQRQKRTFIFEQMQISRRNKFQSRILQNIHGSLTVHYPHHNQCMIFRWGQSFSIKLIEIVSKCILCYAKCLRHLNHHSNNIVVTIPVRIHSFIRNIELICIHIYMRILGLVSLHCTPNKHNKIDFSTLTI